MAPAVSPHLSLVGRDFENGGVSLRRFVTLSLTILLKATFRCQFDPKYSHPPVLFTTPQIRRESKPFPSFHPGIHPVGMAAPSLTVHWTYCGNGESSFNYTCSSS